MKKKFTPCSCLHKRMSPLGFCILLLSLFISVQSFGQDSGLKPDFSYFSTVDWKVTPEVSSAIGVEQAKMDLALAQPGLQQVDRAIYLAYKRLLTYVDADIQGGMAAGEAILKNYEKVLSEAPKDPDLALMPEGYLETVIPGLVEALTAPQVAVPANH